MPFLNTNTSGNDMCGAWSIPGFQGSSTLWNGNVAVFPVFPIVGYVANPCLQGVAMLQADVVNGSLVNTVLYGAEHTYLMGYARTGLGLHNAAVGLRWD